MLSGGEPHMELAIEADDLVKSYPKGVTALDGLSFAVPAGTRVRAARAERRRQVDRGQDPDHAGHARCGPGARLEARRDRQSRRRAPQDRRGLAGLVGRHPGHRAGEPASAGPDLRTARARARAARPGPARAVRVGRRRRPGRARLLAAGCSDASTSRWRSSTTPRSCSSTSRPRGSIPRSGRTCGPRSGGSPPKRQERAPDHALPRGGRPTRRADRDRRPRQGRGGGHPR